MPQGMRIGGVRAIFAGVGVTLCVGLLGCNSSDTPRDSMANKQPPPLPGTTYLQNGSTGTSTLNSTQQRPAAGTGLPTTQFPTTMGQPGGSYAVGSNGTSPTVPNYNPSAGSTGFGTAGSTGSTGGMPSGMSGTSSGTQPNNYSAQPANNYSTQPPSSTYPNANSYGGMPRGASSTLPSVPAGMPGSVGVPSLSGAAGAYGYSDNSIIPPAQPPRNPQQ